MDDLTEKLNQILNSPEGMEQIKNLASLLGQPGEGKKPEDAPGGFDLDGLLGGGQASGGQPGIDPDLMKTVMRLLPLLSSFREEDDNTRLLTALRPLLGESRRGKLDEASRMLRLLKLLPLLREQGIL